MKVTMVERRSDETVNLSRLYVGDVFIPAKVEKYERIYMLLSNTQGLFGRDNECESLSLSPNPGYHYSHSKQEKVYKLNVELLWECPWEEQKAATRGVAGEDEHTGEKNEQIFN